MNELSRINGITTQSIEILLLHKFGMKFGRNSTQADFLIEKFYTYEHDKADTFEETAKGLISTYNYLKQDALLRNYFASKSAFAHMSNESNKAALIAAFESAQTTQDKIELIERKIETFLNGAGDEYTDFYEMIEGQKIIKSSQLFDRLLYILLRLYIKRNLEEGWIDAFEEEAVDSIDSSDSSGSLINDIKLIFIKQDARFNLRKTETILNQLEIKYTSDEVMALTQYFHHCYYKGKSPLELIEGYEKNYHDSSFSFSEFEDSNSKNLLKSAAGFLAAGIDNIHDTRLIDDQIRLVEAGLLDLFEKKSEYIAENLNSKLVGRCLYVYMRLMNMREAYVNQKNLTHRRSIILEDFEEIPNLQVCYRMKPEEEALRMRARELGYSNRDPKFKHIDDFRIPPVNVRLDKQQLENLRKSLDRYEDRINEEANTPNAQTEKQNYPFFQTPIEAVEGKSEESIKMKSLRKLLLKGAVLLLADDQEKYFQLLYGHFSDQEIPYVDAACREIKDSLLNDTTLDIADNVEEFVGKHNVCKFQLKRLREEKASNQQKGNVSHSGWTSRGLSAA